MNPKIINLKKRLISLKLNEFDSEEKECPICNWKGKEFLNLVKKHGALCKNILCPKCNSHTRHRMLYLCLNELLPKNKKPRLIHFAPEGFLRNLIKKHKNIDYLSADIDEKKAMVKEDITNLSFKDNSFDIIICSHVLEHVQDDDNALKELYRILKKEGDAIIIVPIAHDSEKTYENSAIISEKDREKHFGQSDHLRLYGKDFKEKVKNAGFRLKKEISYKDFSDKDYSKFGLGKDIIYVFTK